MAKVENRYAPERQGEPHFCMREIKSLVQDAVAVPAPEPTDQQQAGHYLNAITRTTAVTLKLKGTPAPHPIPGVIRARPLASYGDFLGLVVV